MQRHCFFVERDNHRTPRILFLRGTPPQPQSLCSRERALCAGSLVPFDDLYLPSDRFVAVSWDQKIFGGWGRAGLRSLSINSTKIEKLICLEGMSSTPFSPIKPLPCKRWGDDIPGRGEEYPNHTPDSRQRISVR